MADSAQSQIQSSEQLIDGPVAAQQYADVECEHIKVSASFLSLRHKRVSLRRSNRFPAGLFSNYTQQLAFRRPPAVIGS